jgi:hypothetical protein
MVPGETPVECEWDSKDADDVTLTPRARPSQAPNHDNGDRTNDVIVNTTNDE